MDYRVLTYGDSALREKACAVERVDESVRLLADDMLRAMYAHNGVGLAAEQVGRTEAVCVFDTSSVSEAGVESGPAADADVPMPVVMVNPTIVRSHGEQVGPEGCLSFPEIFVTVRRAAEVDVRYVDLGNRVHTATVRGLLARAVQHELDHLDGVLLVDRMSPVQKVAVAGKLKRLKKKARG